MKLLNLLLIASVILITGCDKYRAKHWGGNMDIQVPKEDNLWYLTRKAKAGEEPDVLALREKSNNGVLEGTVTFKESK